MKGSLLIVDDEPMLSEGLKYMLKNCCENVFIAENGEEAFKIISNNKICCVLTDFYMPVMCGMELFKKVRSTNSQIPFVFYTGNGVDTVHEELASYKNYEVVPKPLLDEVIKRVTTITSCICSSQSCDVP